MQATALAVGDRETHPIGFASITIQRTNTDAYMTVVEHRSTGRRVDQLTSGPWPTEDQAREAARNAYAAFADDRTVEQVIEDLRAAAVYDLNRALDRANHTRAAEVEELLDALTTQEQAAAESAALADIAETIQATRDGRPLSGWGRLQAGFAATHGSAA